MNCPYCNSIIDENDIEKNTVYCQECYEIFDISEYFEAEEKNNFDIENPSKGVWFQQEKDKEIIGATTRSHMGYFLLFFTLIWAKMTVWEIYGTQIIKGDFQIELTLFGIPFIIGILILIWFSALFLGGKVEITIENNKTTIFTGVGNIGFRKIFDINSINNIKLEEKRGSKGNRYKVIMIKAYKKTTFGSLLTEERINFMYFALKQQIEKS